MSNKDNVMEKILSISNQLVSLKKKFGNAASTERLNKFLSSIQSVGTIDKIEINGNQGRYFIIEGHSWENACRALKLFATPGFIMCEESELFSFLETLFTNVEEIKKRSTDELPRAAKK